MIRAVELPDDMPAPARAVLDLARALLVTHDGLPTLLRVDRADASLLVAIRSEAIYEAGTAIPAAFAAHLAVVVSDSWRTTTTENPATGKMWAHGEMDAAIKAGRTEGISEALQCVMAVRDTDGDVHLEGWSITYDHKDDGLWWTGVDHIGESRTTSIGGEVPDALVRGLEMEPPGDPDLPLMVRNAFAVKVAQQVYDAQVWLAL